MPVAIKVTAEIKRIIREGRDATPKPVPWKTIAEAIGAKSWRTPINIAIRLGIYKRVNRPYRFKDSEPVGGKAEVVAAWERMRLRGLISSERPPPL